MLSSFIGVAECTCRVCCQMTLLKIIIKVTHFKTKHAVSYLFFSFSFIVVMGNGGIRNRQISFEFADRDTLCYVFRDRIPLHGG